MEELAQKYPPSKFWELQFEAEDIVDISKQLEEIVKDYFHSELKSTVLDDQLSMYDLMVRAFVLLKDIEATGVKRDINSWESTMKLIKELKNAQKIKKKTKILSAFLRKIKMAEKVKMEVYKMKQFATQFLNSQMEDIDGIPLNRQSRMPTLEEAKKLVKDYNRVSPEIDIKE